MAIHAISDDPADATRVRLTYLGADPGACPVADCARGAHAWGAVGRDGHVNACANHAHACVTDAIDAGAMPPTSHGYHWRVDLHAIGIALRPEVITGACDAPDVARAVGIAVRDVRQRRGIEILGRDVRTDHAPDCARCAALNAAT